MSESCLDVMLNRRSVQDYTDEDVSQDDLGKILSAALRAPSPGGSLSTGYRGMQAFSVIVVRDKERRSQLNWMLCEGKKESIEKAPISLVFCVDLHRINRWAELGGGEPHFRGIGVLWVALRGTYTAAQNAVIAADSLGLGTQYVQEIVWQPYRTLQFFDLPPQVLPVAMLTVGHPAEVPPLAPALPLEAVVHDETYHDPDDEKLIRYFSTKEEFFRDWLKSLPEDSRTRKTMRARGVKNLAQYVSLMIYTDSFYKWRDDVVRANLALSDLE